ncbi:MAG: hypothetical protein FVQ80_05825 [Planctomycetes bacterium]|nr:hypothetical protein [Planctomycetota bacterium]
MLESGNIRKICFAGDTAVGGPIAIGPSLKDILKSHDIAVLNFEGAFSKLGQPLSKAGSHILLEEKYFAPLAECFNVATLANNHVMDYQAEGLGATIEGCEKAGIQTVGAGFNLKETFAPLDIGNCRIISVAEHEFGGAEENKAGIATVDRLSEIYKAIKDGCELGKQVFIVSHGGSELISIPPPYLRERYKLWIDYGACGVIGNHPHVVQGYELYKGRPIFYSLGNFVFIKDDSFDDLPNAQWSIVVSLDVSTGNIQIIPVKSDGGMVDVIKDKSSYTQELARLCDLLKPENYLDLYQETAAELYKIRYPGLPCDCVHSAQVLLHYLRCDAHRSMIESGLVGMIDELDNNVSSVSGKQIDNFDSRDRETKADRAKVTMSSLGHDGRFANQIFQYAFLRDYARKHDLDYETSGWVGQHLFGHKDNPVSAELPQVKEKTPFAEGTFDINSGQRLSNVDIGGYFQYDISWAQQEIGFFRSLFRPVGLVKSEMEKGLAKLRSKGKTIVGLHLRRGDFGYEYFFIAPSRWYLEWLEQIWDELDEPVLFIASDEPGKVVGDFSKYNPVTSQDLGIELPQASFYPDFYFLSQCDVMAISNSSFSFAASLLNERCGAFYRPHLPSRQLVSYDPLRSQSTLFHDKVRPEDDECSRDSNSNAVLKKNDLVTLKTMDGMAMDFPVLPSDSSLVKEIPDGHADIIEDVHRWSNPRLAYLASADQWLGFKAFFEKNDVMQCDVFYCAIGGLGGLNLLGYLNQVKKIVFYDVNAFAALVCDLQLQLIRHCRSVDEYISLIYQRPFESAKYNFENQRDFLQLPIESEYAQKLEQILSGQAYNTYNYYYLPLISQSPCSVYDGATVHCTDLLPFFESGTVRDPLVSGPLSNRSVNINTFYVGKGWLGSDETFLAVRKRLAESEIEIRIGDASEIKPEGQFPGIYITNIFNTGREDGYKQFANMFKWIVGYDDHTDFEVQYFPNHNGLEGMAEYDRRIGVGDGNPHATCCRAIDNVIDLNSNEFLEVIEPHPIEGMNYGFRFYRGQKRISVEDYLKTKVDSEEIIGVHILLGGGTSRQRWREVCRKAVTESKRYVMIFEHRGECRDWPERDVHSDNLLGHRKLDQFIYSLDHRWKKFGMPNVKGDINDIRNVMYFLDKSGQCNFDGYEKHQVKESVNKLLEVVSERQLMKG